MTGFDRWLEAQTRIPYIGNVDNALALLGRYRKSMRPLMPTHGGELAALRKQRKRPAGRIVVTDDVDVADGLIRVDGADYPLLIDGYAAYDFAPLFGLPVLYLMPDEFWALDVMHQIAESDPSAYSLIWPRTEKEKVLWN